MTEAETAVLGSFEVNFEPGTHDDAKRWVAQNLQPAHLIAAYDNARFTLGPDIVLAPDPDDHEKIVGFTRRQFIAETPAFSLKKIRNHPKLGRIAHVSAHKALMLPEESNAFWFVAHVEGYELPIMCVMYIIRAGTMSDGGVILAH